MKSEGNKMKILFLGDSITDMSRNRETEYFYNSYGFAYPIFVEAELATKHPGQYQVLNKGISGNRVVDLYSRIKVDCWNHTPDVVSIFIGVNDVWHGLFEGIGNGVDIERYEKVYRMIIEDTKKRFPKARFVLCEPFVVEGSSTCATEEMPDRYERFCEVYKYASVVKKLSEEYGLYFLPLQKKFDEATARLGVEYYAPDGVHPNIGGSSLVATEWVSLFREKIEKEMV